MNREKLEKMLREGEGYTVEFEEGDMFRVTIPLLENVPINVSDVPVNVPVNEMQNCHSELVA